MVVPEHEPLLYWPLGQLALEQVAHTVLDVPEHPPLLYLPLPQVAQVEHEKPLFAPPQAPVRYCPLAQMVLVQGAHLRFFVGEQAWAWYVPAAQGA